MSGTRGSKSNAPNTQALKTAASEVKVSKTKAHGHHDGNATDSEISTSTQMDLFAAHFTDIPTRDQRDLMERPFFSLAKRPRKKPIDYKSGDVEVLVSPNAEYGIATIWDADVLIWAATQIREALDRDKECGRKLTFQPYNLLKGICRNTSGRSYDELRQALNRLTGTLVKTSIRAKGKTRHATFHWLEGWEELVDEESGRTIEMALTLPDWLFEGIVDQGGVLRIHNDYFKLSGGIQRFLYRVARKHAGNQPHGWSFTMRQLHEKSGSLAKPWDFAIDVRKAVAADNLPEYTMSLFRNEQNDQVVSFQKRDPAFMIEQQSAPASLRGRQSKARRKRDRKQPA